MDDIKRINKRINHLVDELEQYSRIYYSTKRAKSKANALVAINEIKQELVELRIALIAKQGSIE